jgi:hypothetical protein
MRPLLLAVLVLGVVVVDGCGMEASDMSMRTRGSVGVPDDHSLQVVTDQWVCPNLIAASGRPFSAKEVMRGADPGDQYGVFGSAFGPFVPCNTVVPAGKGNCPNTACNQPYRTPGNEGDEPLAFPRFVSPFNGETIDPVALKVVGGEDVKMPDRLSYNYDPKAKRYYEASPDDVVTVITWYEEAVSPKGTPFDPTNNGVKESNGEAVVDLAESIEGVCWRCGGTGGVQEVGGTSIPSNLPNPKNGEADRDDILSRHFPIHGVDWIHCPECAGTGFTEYQAGLPPTYRAWARGQKGFQTVPDAERKWQYPRDESEAAPAGGEGGGETGGGETGGGETGGGETGGGETGGDGK